MGQQFGCCKKQSFGMDASKFERTYSPIFAPFLVNVVVRLLNNSGQRNIKVSDYIGRWGGGIKTLRKCCTKNTMDPQNKKTNWDSLINECCSSTPIGHNVWNELLVANKIRITTDQIQNLENLLMHWVENGHKYRTYGPYPKAGEQELYIQDTIPQRVSEILNYAIINNVFDKSYEKMEQSKKGKLKREITGKQSKHVSGVASQSVEMDDIHIDDDDTDDEEEEDLKEKAQRMDIRPRGKEHTDINPCIWLGIIAIIVLYVAVLILGTDQYMVMSWMSPDNNGFYKVDWGWNGATIANDVDNSPTILAPMHYSSRILSDIEPLLLFIFLLTLIFIVFIIFILLMRKKEGKGYYFYIYKMKIPQRPMIYILFEMINTLSGFLVTIFVALLIYGCIELIPAARNPLLCSGTSCTSMVIPIPHIGFILICFIPFLMSCWIYKYVAQLDYRLDYKTMRLYYPENYDKLNRNSRGIYMYDLLDGMSAARKSILCMLFILYLQNSGLLTIWVILDTNLSNSELSAWLQPHGLGNVNKYQQFDSAKNWIQSGTAFNVFIPIFLCIHSVMLCYFIYVFLTFKVIKLIKYIFLLIVTAEIVVWCCLMLAYYFGFQAYWDDGGESHVSIVYFVEGPNANANTIDSDTTNIFWLPDYGFIVLCMIVVYMAKLWWRIIRAM